MIHRFEPSAGGIARRWGATSPIAGLVVGLGVYFGDGGAGLASAVALGAATTVVGFAFVFLRDYRLRFWTVEISEAGVRAVSRQTEHVVGWAEIIALDESYHGDSWTIEWVKEQTLAPHYLAPESLTISLNAYEPHEAARLVELLRSGVKQFGILEFTKSGVGLPCSGRDDG